MFLESYWAHGTFRELLLSADNIFKKMGKSNISRRELLYQMKLYRTREPPFDILYSMSETPLIWWFSLEDSFPKSEDYLVQLALKLFSIVPHAAGCERVWSKLGWLYGTRRNRLALHKIENMHKLASYYYSHAKQELPYFGVEKTNTEVFEILIDEFLNLDEDDFVKITKTNLNESEENTNLSEETNLFLNNILNLDKFENEFEYDDLSMNEDYYEDYGEETSLTNQLQEDINWDPIEEVEKIIEDI
jgi:hypothetical protein